ncbi:MAG: cyclic nucleotide-binding domain-containing protein [Alphaproteobacteria bacterium]|nr:cyclic nucleotide-binding domain-containing protein [Alphaproteobacteria bacterium]
MTSLDDVVRRLQTLPFFANMDAGVLKLLVFTNERLTYERGDVLCRQGEVGDAAYVLLDGEAEVLVATAEGPVRVAALKGVTLVGEIAILIDVPRTATIRATGRLDALKVTKERFFQLMEDYPGIAIETMRVLASRLEATTAELARARAALHEK